MNPAPTHPLQRLRDDPRPAPEDTAMAVAFAKVEPLAPLSEIESLRLRRRLDREVERRAGRRLWLKRAVAAGVGLLLLEAVAAAAIMAWPAARHRFFGDHRSSSGVAPAPVPALVPEPLLAPVSPPAFAAPLLARPAAPAGGMLGHRKSTGSSSATAPAPAVPTETHDAEDADVALYSRALSRLNAHDPAGALETLRAYRLQHPKGLFASEAAVSEVRADLMLDRETEALSLLDSMHAREFAGYPQASELRLLRAELLGRAERCDEAMPVLSTYLDESTPAAQRERALYAHAVCRARGGDAEGSREDLNAYLHEFPRGRFAGRVRERLKAGAE